MKEGTAGDPFDDVIGAADDADRDDTADSPDATETQRSEQPDGVEAAATVLDDADDGTADAAEDDDDGGVPWAVERSSVKAEREMVQFYLRESTLEAEEVFQREVAETAGYTPYVTDLREAAYLVAMDHPDEVADLLDEWGCEYL